MISTTLEAMVSLAVTIGLASSTAGAGFPIRFTLIAPTRARESGVPIGFGCGRALGFDEPTTTRPGEARGRNGGAARECANEATAGAAAGTRNRLAPKEIRRQRARGRAAGRGRTKPRRLRAAVGSRWLRQDGCRV